MSKFIKHAIIRNKKSFRRMDGKIFRSGHLFKILFTGDWYNTIVAVSLWRRRNLLGKFNDGDFEYIRLNPKSDFMDNFEVVTGQF